MAIHVCCSCGKQIPDNAKFCTWCGAEQTEDIRLNRIPETIEELKAFCGEHNLPLEKMRFFIGEDYRGPRAFGIFRDADGNCVVYKNKSDGSRAVRYQGPDEKRAVRELYEKLKSEIELRRGATAPMRSNSSTMAAHIGSAASRRKKKRLKKIGGILLSVALLAGLVSCTAKVIKVFRDTPNSGYYQYQDKLYYNRYGNWYTYDNTADDWLYIVDVPDLLIGSAYRSYFLGRDYYDDYYDDYGAIVFPHEIDSDYGSSYDEDDDDYDDDDSGFFGGIFDDFDWDDDDDYDSWDSNDTDWDSDW